MRATMVIQEAQGKRLIAKGVAADPAVKNALSNGIVVITLGPTNAYVAEEILGVPVDRGAFAAGYIDDRFNLNTRLGEKGEIVLRRGEEAQATPEEVLRDLTSGDVTGDRPDEIFAPRDTALIRTTSTVLRRCSHRS